MVRKSILAIIVSIIAVSIIVLTLVQDDKVGLATKKDPIKIGITVWSGDAHAFLALKKGLFEKNDVQVDLYFADQYSEIEQKYLAGELDGIFATLTDAINFNINGINSKVVYVTDYSNDADVIVGRAALMSDLKDKTISAEDTDGYSRIFVLKALEKSGLSENDVNFAVIPAHEVLSALENGQIDAGHTWEPTKSDAVKKGYMVLFSGGQIPGTITSTLVFNSKIIEERPDDIMAIVKSMIAAQEYRDLNWKESMIIMADAEGLLASDIESGFDGMNSLDLKENLYAFTNSNSTESLYNSGNFIIEHYKKNGKTNIPPIDDIIEPRFINKLTT
ncbi:MAG: hypothetical protein EB150_07360 [Nitrososphaeria archaeon]|nr:hypothetical protein [Nitrososphaeria archaeon]NDB52014.1 hypothetical protein [Nitrosopumilaceae archaeon]NDB88363.1 hypothetical protein [Nitrososphaerota archaeon]NDB46918.1 hypothetical protein [Nitrososphaeria archaeon]NDB90303.1 hypothetical protein [Nitrososphaerota archaeon]